MNWTKVDTLNYSGFQNLILFHDPGKVYMLMKIELFTETISVIIKGEFIEIQLEQQTYYAYSVSHDQGILPYKIYIKQ